MLSTQEIIHLILLPVLVHNPTDCVLSDAMQYSVYHILTQLFVHESTGRVFLEIILDLLFIDELSKPRFELFEDQVLVYGLVGAHSR